MVINEKVSILLPVYNMENKIMDSVDKLTRLITPFLSNYEVVMANDGSSDNSEEAMLEVKEKYPDTVKFISYKKNQGKGWALKKAFEISTGEYIVLCDSDMEIPPTHIEEFFDIMKTDKSDIVIGSKRHKDSFIHYSGIRKCISFIYFLFVKIFFHLPIKDTQTGLKLFRRDAVENIFPRILVKAFAYDLELLAALNTHGKKISQAPITIEMTRHFGMIPIKTLWKTFIDTIAIFYRLNIVKYYERLFSKVESRPMFSILISIDKVDKYIEEALYYIKKQIYDRYEVIILVNRDSKSKLEEILINDTQLKAKVKLIEKDTLSEIDKAEILKNANGSILTFIANSSYPETTWLLNAARAFNSEDTKAVCGPSLYIKNKSLILNVIGKIYSSKLISTKYTYKYLEKKVKYIDRYTFDNFFVYKEDFLKDPSSLGDILYSPEVLTYQHKENKLISHLKEVGSKAYNAGYSIRTKKEKPSAILFIPTLFLLYIISIVPLVIFTHQVVRYITIIPAVLYIFILGVSALSTLNRVVGFLKSAGIFLTHISYGFFFLKGLLKIRGKNV